ncbi:MAG: hypothetical protein JNM57_16820 [Cyclobacteriaceae bacterium]|nr:hypothetical protein [Cyclobacteriaceae bacterium]
MSNAQSTVTASVLSASESLTQHAQPNPSAKQKVVVATGTRFAYPLVQKWIDDYSIVNPNVQIVIESRGTSDPAQYDILIEASEPTEELKKSREFIYVARYAILPVANSNSTFSKIYGEKGVNTELINQLFFHDIYADKEKEQTVKAPYTIYTRLQKAGAPIVFAKYFGFEQKDIKGKAIAGADEHLLKAILRDSTALSYLPLTLVYDHTTGKPVSGITVVPVDLNGNDRVSDDEKFYNELGAVLQRLESKDAKDFKNVPIEYIHLSVDKRTATLEAVDFLRWVIDNGQKDLHAYGYLVPEPKRLDKGSFDQFAAKRIKQ